MWSDGVVIRRVELIRVERVWIWHNLKLIGRFRCSGKLRSYMRCWLGSSAWDRLEAGYKSDRVARDHLGEWDWAARKWKGEQEGRALSIHRCR